jgi:hypothetical protein
LLEAARAAALAGSKPQQIIGSNCRRAATVATPEESDPLAAVTGKVLA